MQCDAVSGWAAGRATIMASLSLHVLKTPTSNTAHRQRHTFYTLSLLIRGSLSRTIPLSTQRVLQMGSRTQAMHSMSLSVLRDATRVVTRQLHRSSEL